MIGYYLIFFDMGSSWEIIRVGVLETMTSKCDLCVQNTAFFLSGTLVLAVCYLGWEGLL